MVRNAPGVSGDDPFAACSRRAVLRVSRRVGELERLRQHVRALTDGREDGEPLLSAAARAVEAAVRLRAALSSYLAVRVGEMRQFVERVRELAEAEEAVTEETGHWDELWSAVAKTAVGKPRNGHHASRAKLRSDRNASPPPPPPPNSPAPHAARPQPAKRSQSAPAPSPRRRGRNAKPFFFDVVGPWPDRYDQTWRLPPGERTARENELLATLAPVVGESVQLSNGSRLVTLRRLTREMKARAEEGRRRLKKLGLTP